MTLKSKIIFLVVLFFIGMNVTGYKLLISNTSSLPYLFFIQTPNKDYATGKIVTFKYQFKNYFKYTQGDNFTKVIGCSQGQKIERRKDDFFCDGVFLGIALKSDGMGNKIESVNFDEIIPQGKYFMIGTNPYSYDSKYYGYVDEKDIVGVTYGLF